MAITNEIVTKFSFFGSMQPLKKFVTDSKSAAASAFSFSMNLGKLALGAAAAGTAFMAFTGRAHADLLRLSKTTQTSVERIQALRYASREAGGTFDAMDGTLTSLAEHLGAASRMGSDQLAALGLQARKANNELMTPSEALFAILDRLRSEYKHLPDLEKIHILRGFGIDSTLLNKSSEELKSLMANYKSVGVVTEAEAKKGLAVNIQIDKELQRLKNLKDDIAIELAPSFITGLKFFGEFVNKNRDNIVGMFSDLAKHTGTLAAKLLEVVNLLKDPSMGALKTILGVSQSDSVGEAAAKAAVKAAARANPASAYDFLGVTERVKASKPTSSLAPSIINNNTINIEVMGTHPQQTAVAVKNALQQQLNDLSNLRPQVAV